MLIFGARTLVRYAGLCALITLGLPACGGDQGSANDLTQSAEVANAGLTSYVVTNLSSGTWFFGVSAYSTTGAESSLSGVVSQKFM